MSPEPLEGSRHIRAPNDTLWFPANRPVLLEFRSARHARASFSKSISRGTPVGEPSPWLPNFNRSWLKSAVPNPEPFNVVILYDKPAAGGLAVGLYGRLMNELADDCLPELRVWRLDMAAAAELSPEANRDLAAADLIVIAAHGRQTCPSTLRCPPDRTGPLDEPPGQALVVLLEVAGEPDPTSGAWIELLRPTVARRRTEFFEWKPDAEEPCAGLPSPGSSEALGCPERSPQETR